MKIPIYRAKKINSDEYVIGFYVFSNIDRDTHLIRIDETYWEDTGLVYTEVEIDPSTLSINFEDMLDNEGNKIFASLSEDGKGGDMLTFDKDEPSTVCKIENGQPIYKSGNVILAKKYLHLKITGVKQ